MPIDIYSCIRSDDITNLEKLIISDPSCLELREGYVNYTPLMSACWSLKIEMVKLLLIKGANIYALDIWQSNALHIVVSELTIVSTIECNKVEALWTIAKFLLEREAQLISEGYVPVICLIDSKNDIGLTPLDMAVPKPEVHARLLRLIDEVADEFEKRDDSRLFSQSPTKTVAKESQGGVLSFFLRRRRQSMQTEEETALVRREPISVGGASKPKVE